MGSVITDRTVTHHSPKSWAQSGAGSNPVCVSAVKNWTETDWKITPSLPALLWVYFVEMLKTLGEAGCQLFHGDQILTGTLTFRTNAASRACCLSCPDWWSCQRECALLPALSLELEGPHCSEKDASAVHWAFTTHWMKGREETHYKERGAGVSFLIYL